VRHAKKWGAIGLSRRPDLMNKELKYTTLSDLVLDFKGISNIIQESYERNHHRLLKIKMGLPVTHNVTSNEQV
jgi:tubulinyl-Tyr carboxypeptidase